MKRSLISLGLVASIIVVTFFVNEGLKNAKLMEKHSRIDSYLELVLAEFNRKKSSDFSAIRFLSEDKSHGLVGFDPWGVPYEYLVKKEEKSLTVILFSKGEDQESQTDLLKFRKESELFESGDDFLYKKVLNI